MCDKMINLATYNIWNSEIGMPLRKQYLVDEIKKVSPDILCLQEVKNHSFAEYIADKLGTNYFFQAMKGKRKEFVYF